LIDRRTFLRDGATALSALVLRASSSETATGAGGPLGARRLMQAQSTRPLVLRGATLVDVNVERPIPDAVVVLEGERIARVLQSSYGQIPSHAEVVDLRGKWILPGFIDMHVHGTNRPDVPLELYVAMGVTSIRDLGGNVTALRLVRKEVANAARLGPRLFFAGPILDGDPPAAPRLAIIADTRCPCGERGRVPARPGCRHHQGLQRTFRCSSGGSRARGASAGRADSWARTTGAYG